jgi:putative mycofactocin binding protein MftB
MVEEKRYRLASGSQVREEDFGLLFYSMQGPRLYFFTCGSSLSPLFFEGKKTLPQCVKDRGLSERRALSLAAGLDQLKEKGVILEC